jgi:hypothetical protein
MNRWLDLRNCGFVLTDSATFIGRQRSASLFSARDLSGRRQTLERSIQWHCHRN